MRYISTFSGIEAASVAWEPLGWEPVAFSEVDDFPSAVLAERFPDVPNLGDITKVDWSEYRGAVDLVVGGSPCQSFSIAGDRTGLDGASGLMWEYVRCIREVRPRWCVWENVPGALSSAKGEDFRCLLDALDELGYGLAWRVLDAQFFGVAQRRRRVFLVGSLRDRRSADVLFEPESLRWDSPSSREKREAIAKKVEGISRASGFRWYAGPSRSIDYEEEQSPTLTTVNPPAACYTMVDRCGKPGGGKGPLIQDDMSGTILANNSQTLFQPVLCMTDTQPNTSVEEDMCGTLSVHTAKDQPVISTGYIVRKLTPTECERLQGFPDGWTEIEFKGKKAPDSRRYKALGNSMAVPVMRWIGERIAMVDALPCPV